MAQPPSGGPTLPSSIISVSDHDRELMFNFHWLSPLIQRLDAPSLRDGMVHLMDIEMTCFKAEVEHLEPPTSLRLTSKFDGGRI